MIKIQSEAGKRYYEQPFGFPAHDVDPYDKKEKAWCKKFCEAFYSLWLRNESILGWNEKLRLDALRLYAVGRQPEEYYMDRKYGRDRNGAIVRKGWYNVDWEIFKMHVKFRNAFLGMFKELDYDIQATGLDPFSRSEKEESKWRMWAQIKYGTNDPNIANMAVGLPPSPPQQEVQPESVEELDIFESLGYFKLKQELAYERAIKATFDTISRFDLDVKEKIFQDLWDIGRAMVRDYVDVNTQKVKVQYVDPANAIVRRNTDGSIMDGGVFELMSIADLRAEIKNSGCWNGEETELQLRQAAMGFVGIYGNPQSWYRDKKEYSYLWNGYTYYIYDDWKVVVMNAEYRTENQIYTTKVTKEGKPPKFYPDRYGHKYKNSKSKETIIKSQITYYRAKWVISTDIVYDYGEQFDIPRPQKTDARCSFHFAYINGPCPTEIIKPVIDQFQLAWLTFQNNMARVMPKGYAYDEAVLLNTIAGAGGKITVDQMISMAEQTGRFVFRSMSARNQPVASPNVGHPIIPMDGGVGTAIEDFVAIYNLCMDMYHEMTGITPQASASLMPAKVGKGVSEIALSATTNALKTIVGCYEKIKQSAAVNALERLQIVLRHNKEAPKDYVDILGEPTVELLRITAEKSTVQYGISLVARINDEIRAELKDAAIVAMQANRDGGEGITFPEYLLIMSMIDQNQNPKTIMAAIAMFISRRQKKIAEEKQAAIQAQGQENKQLQAAAAEQTTRLEVLKSYLKIQENTAKVNAEGNVQLAQEILSPLVTNAFQIMGIGQQPAQQV